MTLVTTDMVITKEETFDPVAPLYPGEIAGFGGSNRPPAFSLAGRSSDRLFPHLDADLIPDDPQCIF